MKFDETHKGYRISYQRHAMLAALIARPGEPYVMSEIAKATHEEGMGVLKARVHAIIDEDIAKTKK